MFPEPTPLPAFLLVSGIAVEEFPDVASVIVSKGVSQLDVEAAVKIGYVVYGLRSKAQHPLRREASCVQPLASTTQRPITKWTPLATLPPMLPDCRPSWRSEYAGRPNRCSWHSGTEGGVLVCADRNTVLGGSSYHQDHKPERPSKLDTYHTITRESTRRPCAQTSAMACRSASRKPRQQPA